MMNLLSDYYKPTEFDGKAGNRITGMGLTKFLINVIFSSPSNIIINHLIVLQ
jgi:hypothetical protein